MASSEIIYTKTGKSLWESDDVPTEFFTNTIIKECLVLTNLLVYFLHFYVQFLS